jgi:hypothetical protein
MQTIDLKYAAADAPWLKDIPKPPGFDAGFVPVVQDEVAAAKDVTAQRADKQPFLKLFEHC